jgi:hypothetical protein
MIKTFKHAIWQLLNYVGIGGAVQLLLKSALKDDGWFRSFHTKQSVDRNGNPLPWLTYSSIKFIEPRLKREFIVHEYGSGNSTLWFSHRVSKVVSVEHQEQWFDKLKEKRPANVELIYKSLDAGSEYEDAVLERKEVFDIMIVDGRRRVKCAANSLKKIKPDGVIIFDNSEREDYKDAISLLEKASYKRIDFWGLGPGIHIQTCTSIFYKSNNCIDI